jgi:hypothetical protein
MADERYPLYGLLAPGDSRLPYIGCSTLEAVRRHRWNSGPRRQSHTLPRPGRQAVNSRSTAEDPAPQPAAHARHETPARPGRPATLLMVVSIRCIEQAKLRDNSPVGELHGSCSHPPWLAARLSRRVAGIHGPSECSFRSWGCSGWSAGGEGLQDADRGGDVGGPGPSGGEAEPQAADLRLEIAAGIRDGEEKGNHQGECNAGGAVREKRKTVTAPGDPFRTPEAAGRGDFTVADQLVALAPGRRGQGRQDGADLHRGCAVVRL